MGDMTISRLLFGEPLTTRPDDVVALSEDLNCLLVAVCNVLDRDLQKSDMLEQAKLEWRRVTDMEPDHCGVIAKRAALLFAMWREPCVMDYFVQREPELGADLRDRVLPLVMPSFVAGMAQRPDALVIMVAVLCEMWAFESMGMHVEKPVGGLRGGADGEGGGPSAGWIDGDEDMLSIVQGVPHVESDLGCVA